MHVSMTDCKRLDLASNFRTARDFARCVNLQAKQYDDEAKGDSAHRHPHNPSVCLACVRT